jgi:predicted nucleotidyltransferase
MAKAKQQRDERDLAHYVALLRQHLPALREHYGVCFMGIFGSYVRSEQQRGSDLDLLVEFDDRPYPPRYVAPEIPHYWNPALSRILSGQSQRVT